MHYSVTVDDVIMLHSQNTDPDSKPGHDAIGIEM